MSEEAIAAGGADEEVAAMFDLANKKKKKKKDKTKKDDTDSTKDKVKNEDTDSNSNEPKQDLLMSPVFETDSPPYDYRHLLDRVVDLLSNKNPDWQDKRRNTMKPPQLSRVGTKKTLWTNFQEICKMMHRNPEHVFQFMMAELGTEGSIDGNLRLVIRGKFVPKYIESLLRKYILEYVSCQMCRSFNTELSRDSVSRLYFVKCGDCGSSKSVAPIRAGYHAQTRADRRALRNA